MMSTPPFTAERNIYKELEDRAKYANLSVDERRVYDSQLKAYRDYNNQLQYKYDEGRAEGIEKGIGIGVERGRAEGIEKGRAEAKKETAKLMKEQGIDEGLILSVLKLTPEQLSNFLNSSN